MRVISLVFREMGSYNDMPIRPFNTSYKGHYQESLAEATREGRDLEPTVLSGLAGRIIRPSSKVEGVANIAGGWAEPRMMFVMEVEVRTTRTCVTTEIITGYTDHVGLSNMDGRSVRIDPEMTLHFSGVFHVRKLQALGKTGMKWDFSIHDAAQILSRQSRADLSMPRGSNGSLTVRPEDLFVTKVVPDQFRDAAHSAGYRDMRVGFNRNKLKLSRRGNAQASQYLSRGLKGYVNAQPNDFVVDSREFNDNERFISARGAVKEPLITADPVFEELMADTAVMDDGFITYGELLSMAGNRDLDKIVEVYTPQRGEHMHRRGDSANWGDPDNETIAATIIANTIPAYLMDCMYSGIHFTSTNNTAGGLFETRVARLQPFIPDTDIDENFNRLINRIEAEMMLDLTLNREMIIDVEVISAVYGDTKIFISIDGDHEREFVFPTFCESVVSPMVTDSQDTVELLANDISKIGDYLAAGPSPINQRGNIRGKTL